MAMTSGTPDRRAPGHTSTALLRSPSRKFAIVNIDGVEELADEAADVEERMTIDEMSICVREVVDRPPAD